MQKTFAKIDRIVEEKTQCFDRFARVHGRYLQAFFLGKGCQKATADDLSQEVFAKLLAQQEAPTLTHEIAYLRKVAFSVWCDYLRERKSRATNSHIEYHDAIHAVGDFSSEQICEGREAVETRFKRLKELPRRTAEIFYLCRIEALTQQLVAERLGISLSCIEKHMRRATAYVAG